MEHPPNDAGPLPSDHETFAIRIEVLLVIVFLSALTVLDIVTGTPWFQAIQHTRLTYLSIVTAVGLATLAVVRHQWTVLRNFLYDWWPLLGALAVYESLKHMHANRITLALGIRPLDRVMMAADTFLFGKPLPLYFDSWTNPLLVSFFWFSYIWVYYLMPVVMMGWAYFALEDRELFWRLRRGTILGLLGGYVLYLVVPVAGPLFLIGDRFTHVSPVQPTLHNLVFNTLRYNWDCFPSLHTAIPWLLTILAWRRVRRPFRILLVLASASVTLSTLVLRAHWGIDLVAGMLWAGLVALFITRTASRSWEIRLPVTARYRRLRVAPLWRLGGLFALSGYVALMVEQGFEKMLQPVVGVSGYSTAAVLAMYFLGLSLGGALYGWWLHPRWPDRPLRLYAILEGPE